MQPDKYRTTGQTVAFNWFCSVGLVPQVGFRWPSCPVLVLQVPTQFYLSGSGSVDLSPVLQVWVQRHDYCHTNKVPTQYRWQLSAIQSLVSGDSAFAYIYVCLLFLSGEDAFVVDQFVCEKRHCFAERIVWTALKFSRSAKMVVSAVSETATEKNLLARFFSGA